MRDVVITGGGPVGMFLACELRLAGAEPLVLERRTSPSTVDKAHGFTGQVVRLLDHRGLYERCGGDGPPTPAPGFFYGALPLELHRLGRHNPMYLLWCHQRDLEAVLNERAAELGVEVRRGWEVVSATQTDDQVDVTATTDDATSTTLAARYLVGCDGGHSVVRKQTGIGFPGIVDDHVVDRAALIGPSKDIKVLPDGRAWIRGVGEIASQFHRTERGVFILAASDPERPFLGTTEWEDRPAGNSPGPGVPMTMGELEDSVERVLGVRVTLPVPPADAPTLLRRLCGRNTRLAERYRDRRIFLAGDAAHVHAASGGPGLNLALQDAANLAWKLAATVQGWAPDRLLDTYDTERHAVGDRVFMQTQAQTALMSPGSSVTALRQLVAEMLDRTENIQLVADLMAGTDVRFDMGDNDPGPLVGRFTPPLELTLDTGEHTRLAELQRDGRPLLVDLTGDGDLLDAAQPWSDRITLVGAAAAEPPAPALLIRPDGYIAWTGTDTEALQEARDRWFGDRHARARGGPELLHRIPRDRGGP